MFGNKKKVELDDKEVKIIFDSLIDFRNNLIKEGKDTDWVNNAISKLKNKMKVDKYEMGIIINGLDGKRKILDDTDAIDHLILKLLDIYKTF